MSNTLPGAKPSPRVTEGRLYWYEGDTFAMDILLDLTDQDGEPLDIGAGDTLTLTFYNHAGKPVHSVTYSSITGNKVTLTVDETVSGKFAKGEYTYDARYIHGDKTTVARGNGLRVE